MSLFTYLKIAGMVIILGICSYYVYNYHSMKSLIYKQQLEIAELKLTQDILKEKQKVFDEYIIKKDKIKRRVSSEQRDIETEVSNTNDDNLRGLYGRYKLQPKSNNKSSNTRKGGSSEPKIR